VLSVDRAPTAEAEVPVIAVGPRGERPKLHVVIARDIRTQIERAGWPIGEVLGSEASLAHRYGVSSSIMREAGRLLEHQRIVSMTRGPAGGFTVREPSAEAVAHAIAIVFDFSGVSLGELLCVKALLEQWSARQTALRATPQVLDRLDRANVAMSSGESALAHRHDGLHGAIAQESGNPVAAMLHAAVTSVVVRYSPAALRQDAAPADTADTVRRAHTRIVDAIRAGDADLAERRMSTHVEAMSQWLLTSHGERALRSDVDVRRAVAFGARDRAKLAEIVAERIRDDIHRTGWEVGAWLGTEPTLLERYAVSRSVLREAIRLLEHHAVVAYRAGTSGGLVVGRPNGDSIVDAASSYLDYHRVTVSDLDAMRTLFESQGARLAATRGPAATAVLARHLVLADHEQRRLPCASDLHLALGQVSGNRALGLIVELLVHLRSTMPATGHAVAGEQRSPAAVHALIVEAVLSGQADEAASLMAAHLDAQPRPMHLDGTVQLV
jgi:DNA-binding FadR family transcriptional regulator